MRHYKSFDFASLPDRRDLVYSPLFGTIDFIVNNGLVCAWGFAIDDAPLLTCYGRTLAELNEFLEKLKNELYLSQRHKLVIFAEDLSNFFWYAHRDTRFFGEFIARSEKHLLLCEWQNCIKFQNFKEYFELELNSVLEICPPNFSKFSDVCEMPLEIDNYLDMRVTHMHNAIRHDLDIVYQGNTGHFPLTLTQSLTRRFYSSMEKYSSKNSPCNIRTQIRAMNPLSTEEGRRDILPQLQKAFFGGISLHDPKYKNMILDNVVLGDFSSAYVAQMIFKKYPISKFKAMPIISDLRQLVNDPEYNRKALLISLQIENLEVLPDGVPFLVSDIKNQWIDKNKSTEIKDQANKAAKKRIKKAKILRTTLTDIDFKLLTRNYKFDKIEILSIFGAKYGSLPDYILQELSLLYSQKVTAKEDLKMKEMQGIAVLDDYNEYEEIKSRPARAYGIFTKSPVTVKYRYDPDTCIVKIDDPAYINPRAASSPVLYQWGVWTTAHVRRELLTLRRQLLPFTPVYYGDTDSLVFDDSATAMQIISEYNDNVNNQIRMRADQLGIDSNQLRGLGIFESKKYKHFRYTATKQYAYIQETENGDQFNFRAAGLSRECQYFNAAAKRPIDKINLFMVGATIPAEYAPRKVTQYIDAPTHISYIDMDGNQIERDIKCHINTFYDFFSLGGAGDNISRGKYSDISADLGDPRNINNLYQYKRKIVTFSTI